MHITEITRGIIHGHRLTKDDDVSFLLDTGLLSLCKGADAIRKALCKDEAHMCGILNGRSGRCGEDCAFCAQSAWHDTDCEEYGFLSPKECVAGCKEAERAGLERYSIVTAGRTLEGDDLALALRAYREMHAACPNMKLCASHGLMEEQDLRLLKEAGVTQYHANLETSERFFPEICTTHSYADKIEEIRRAKAAGLTVCSGGIFGMGETWQDRIDMAFLLSELEITSIPMNFLIAIPGTPLAGEPALSREEMLRIVALFRYIHPTATLRIAAGRILLPENGADLFRSGANGVLTGDMLTTTGSTAEADRNMLIELGYQ